MQVYVQRFSRDSAEMPRKKTPQPRKKTPQIAITLSPDMRESLEALAKAKGVPFAEELRRRVERTVEQDRFIRTRASSPEGMRYNAQFFEDEIISLLQNVRADVAEHPKETRELASDLRELARNVSLSRSTGWFNNSEIHKAFVVALTTYLEAMKPPPERDSQADLTQLQQRGYDAESMGRTVAHLLLRRKADEKEREEAFQEKHQDDAADAAFHEEAIARGYREE